MTHKKNIDEINRYVQGVYIVRMTHDVIIWFALVSLLISVIWFNHRHLRFRSEKIFYCCIFAICSVIISTLLLLFNYSNMWHDEIAWTTRIGTFSWLLMLLYSIQHVYIPNLILNTLLLLLVLTEWVNIAVQLLSPIFYTVDIIADIALVVPHSFLFVVIADWKWLMVHEITSVFRWKSITTTTTMESEISSDVYNNSFQSNLLPLPREMSADIYSTEMRFGRTHSLLYILIRRWGGMYILLALVRLVYELGGLLPAYLLRTLVDTLVQAQTGKTKNGERNFQTSLVVLFFIILCTVIVTFLRVHYNMKLKKIAVYNRGFLTMILFKCSLNRRKYEIENKTQGEIMNHLTVDVQRVADAVQTINDIWALPLQLVFALYLLYIQVSFAFIAGVAITLLLIPVNALIAKRIKQVQTNLMKENDERVLIITEIVNNILYIKMCGWSHLVQKWVKIPREHYMKYLTWLKYLDALCVFFWAATPTLVSLFTFITFIWMGGDLTPGKAVTALALFGSLIMPLNAYPWVINGFMEAYVSWKRLEPFLTMKSYEITLSSRMSSLKDMDNNIKLHIMREEEGDELGKVYKIGERQPLLDEKVMTENVCQLKKSYSANLQLFEETNSDLIMDIKESGIIGSVLINDLSFQDDFILRIPRFQASRGQLIAIVGSSGSGKSTFLNSLAGEMLITSTSTCTNVISITPPSIAYVEQQPFLISGTIRENILFGLAYDSRRYETVIHAVALVEDLNYCFTPDGDNSHVGDRGGLLSGGQKVRIALARALYADKEVYLIDDLLGCLDATVVHHIITEVFVATAKRGSCVIVVTHNEELIKQADAVYLCDGGNILYTNQFNDMNGSSLKSIQRNNSDSFITESTIRKEDVPIEENVNKEEEGEKKNNTIKEITRVENEVIDRIISKPILEASERGSLSLHTITCYISRIGWKLSGFIVVSVIAMQLSRNLSDQYVVVWSKDDNNNNNTTVFLRTLGLLAILNSLLALLRGFSFAIGGLKAAERIHDELLNHVLSATFTFFSNTPPGRIINRMTKDIGTIDDSLPFITNILLAQTFLFIGSLIIILVNSSLVIIILLLPLLLSYYYIQRPYRILSRGLRRLESAADAPLLDTLRDALDGGVLMRSLGRETLQLQLHRAKESLELILRIQYNALMLNAWFALRLELVGIVLLIFVGSVALFGYGSTHAPLLGLALAYVQPLTSYVNGVLGALISTEKELISVERVRQYFQLPNEERNGKTENEENEEEEEENICLLPQIPWPSVGVISFTKVSMRYDLSSRQVLQELTFHVNSGEKVAIVGRTGAGKSSIFAALLRLVNLDSGSITIDEMDVRQIPLEFLRTSIGILPQEPFIFHGTLRKNLDPFNIHTDEEIYAVLDSVNLREYAIGYDILNSEIVSGGQRQQIAVARVLLQKSRILLLDEPTSQSSVEAELSLWKMLETYLNGTTVLCITHKLTHIDFFDRIIVINDGRVVNSGTPAELRQNHSWPFSLDVNSSHLL